MLPRRCGTAECTKYEVTKRHHCPESVSGPKLAPHGRATYGTVLNEIAAGRVCRSDVSRNQSDRELGLRLTRHTRSAPLYAHCRPPAFLDGRRVGAIFALTGRSRRSLGQCTCRQRRNRCDALSHSLNFIRASSPECVLSAASLRTFPRAAEACREPVFYRNFACLRSSAAARDFPSNPRSWRRSGPVSLP